MASKKSDQDLIDQLVRELQAAGEEFTFDPAEALLASRTTSKQPRLGPGDRMSVADTKRAVAFYGPKAVAALDGVTGALRLRGDVRVFWIGRVEAVDPEDVEIPITFDGHTWRDAPPAPERLGAVLRTLPLDLGDERVRDSVLQACEALVGQVVHTRQQAIALTRHATDGFDVPPVPAPAELVQHFEPPHTADRAFVFCVNLRYDLATDGPSFLRLCLDMDTMRLDVQRLCRGQIPGLEFLGDEGRAFVDDTGRQLRAPLRTTDPHRALAVAAWHEAAAAEHASIASFARATLELMAVGAPLSLVARSQQAALDEVRHARLSLAVARRLAGHTATVVVDELDEDAFGPLPVVGPRAASLALVATTTLTEAAIPETLAALCAGVAARRCRHDDVRAILDEIHLDEARHAALAWDIVDWCVAHNDDARAAVVALAATLGPPATSASCVDNDDDGQLCAGSGRRCAAVAFEEQVRPRLQRFGRST